MKIELQYNKNEKQDAKTCSNLRPLSQIPTRVPNHKSGKETEVLMMELVI